MQTATASREHTIAKVMEDDPALSRAEAEALYDAAPASPSLSRPLQWNGPDIHGEVWARGSLAGNYVIRRENDAGCRLWLTVVGGYFHTVESAKAAAQAHEEAELRKVMRPDLVQMMEILAAAPQSTFAARCAAAGITLPVGRLAGDADTIVDARGRHVAQVDPLGVLDDIPFVEASANLIVEAINLAGDVLMEGQTIG